MDCRHHEEELTRLRAALSRERARSDRLETELMQAVRLQAEALVTLARNARSVTVTRDSVTGTVTLEEKEEKKREGGRVRQQIFRDRQRSVTASRSHATETVTPPPPSPSEGQGNLRVVTQAARYGERHAARIHRDPDSLPPLVRKLRQAWNDQCAMRGFPAWGVTSGKLLEDADTALKRRPLEEWQRVFSLVPRSPVCRGELGSKQRASYVWILVGTTRDGYEPAECLLSGAWSLDPEPQQEEPEPGTIVDCDQLQEGPGGEAALQAWHEVLAGLRKDNEGPPAGRLRFLLQNLAKVAPVTVEGSALVLLCADHYTKAWLEDCGYSEALAQRLAPLGLQGVVFRISPEEAEREQLRRAEQEAMDATQKQLREQQRARDLEEFYRRNPLSRPRAAPDATEEEPPPEPGAGAL